MFSEQFEQLITEAVEDGQISDLERRVLEKRAVKEGIDLDELEMVIESRLIKRRRELMEKSNQAPAAPAAAPVNAKVPPAPPAPAQMAAPPKAANTNPNKMGSIKKCPNCNATVPAGKMQCVECGYAFRDVAVSNSLFLLDKKLEMAENNVGSENFLTQMMGPTSYQKQSKLSRVVRDFPVPSAKEDLMEFMLACRSRGQKHQDARYTVQGAYYAKYMECYEKARIYYANDPDFAQLIADAEKMKGKSIFKSIFGKK